MKVRNLAVLATVAVGAIALAAPTAFAADAKASKSKSQTRTDNDIKRLGNNVNDLRKADDETNARISRIVDGLGPVLNQLGDAAKSYANFQYGFVQLTFGGTPVPTFFAVTPRLDPTMQQSTVTRQFVVPAAAGANPGDFVFAGKTIGANVGVRSINDPQQVDNESTAVCSVTATNVNNTTGVQAGRAMNTGNGAYADTEAEGLPFYPIQRSSLKPNDKADNLPSLVGQVPGDRVDNLLVSSKTQAGFSLGSVSAASALGSTITVTLSCSSINNKELEDNGVTPPFKK